VPRWAPPIWTLRRLPTWAHPHARVELGVSVQRGFNGLAPWAVSVQFLTLSLGKSYDHRAATPVVQFAADVTAETVREIREYIKSLPVDPVLDERCLLWDANGDLMIQQPLGTRSPDGKYCLVEGEKLPIGENWWRDRSKSVICHDKKLIDCLMYRRPHEHSYRVLHRPWVGDDCVVRENVYDPSAPSIEKGQTHRTVELAVLGSVTKDRKGCMDSSGYVHSIGAQYYREHGHLWVCDAPRIEEQRDRCFLALAELPQKMQNQTTPVGRIARALDHGMARKAQAIDKLPDQAVGVKSAACQLCSQRGKIGRGSPWLRGEGGFAQSSDTAFQRHRADAGWAGIDQAPGGRWPHQGHIEADASNRGGTQRRCRGGPWRDVAAW
jgi:hypothetical protein